MRTFVLIRDLVEDDEPFVSRDHVTFEGERYVIGDRIGRLAEPDSHMFELLPLPQPRELKIVNGAKIIRSDSGTPHRPVIFPKLSVEVPEEPSAASSSPEAPSTSSKNADEECPPGAVASLP